MPTKIRASVPSRIAISLYDMNGSLGRIDGGMGFSLKWPRLCFTAIKTDNQNIIIKSKNLLDEEITSSIIEALRKIQKFYNTKGVLIRIEESIPSHCGFGSKTATLLSLSYVYAKIYNTEVDFLELAVLLKRGGTSGIGINLINKGGFILEGGHSNKKKKDFIPSSSVKKVYPAPIIAQFKMPNWPFLICIPRLPRIHGKNERQFFRNTCPIKEDEVAKLARITLSQALPSVIEMDHNVFCKAVNSIQKIGWKRSEIEIYEGKILSYMKLIKDAGAEGVGMSSIGPGIYALGSNLSNIREFLLNNNSELWKDIQITYPCNQGMTIEICK